MRNLNNSIGSNQCYLPDLAGSSHLGVQSATHSSRWLLALWLAAGFLTWVSISIADEKPVNPSETMPTGTETSAGNISKMQQEAMNMLKAMQQSGLIPEDVEIPADVLQSGGAEPVSRSASTNSSREKKSAPRPEDEEPARTATAELLQPNAEYSAISYMGSADPGAMKYSDGLSIQQAPGMIRFQSAENKQEAILIFRYDKGIVWAVHPEDRRYPGVKKYQEFELRDGMGFDSHIDNIMQAYAAVKNRDEMKNLGKETVDGYATSHFQKRDPIPWLPNEFLTTDYWVSDSGVLIKVTVVTPEVSSVMETKAIRFGKQPAALFVPPSDYEKAGNVIDWAEEARIIKAAGAN
ncbi:MAG: hypothetical protein GXP15_12555 [Gammaproteobacteria bacterium]|nr:hypothetical protein [Gammaproteobacteria bacterium]